jgi:hypothetical protein
MEKWTKGQDYDRLLSEFIELKGDLSQCPFDTEDYKYQGPTLKDGKIQERNNNND